MEDRVGVTADVADLAEVQRVATDAEDQAGKALTAAMSARIDLGSAEIAFRSVVSVAVGVRSFDLSVPDARVGDRVYVHPTATWAAGYAALGNGFVSQDGHVEIRLLTPVVTLPLVGDVKLPVRLVAFRAAN